MTSVIEQSHKPTLIASRSYESNTKLW